MADEERIRSRARRLGYNLLKIVAFGVHTDRPMERLTNVVKHLEVEAVFTPNLHHFDGFEIPRELHAIATVYTVDQESEYKRKRRRAHQGRRA
ncbi:hypothetical protein [Nocardia sp. BMG51109]|uniref:hypothetical protein n=1 Tax=Nocardia sp. BMG51109 TaxID=1056816 RepID=UPI001E458CCF|nr:hypothetical protein [Nocardia sp. BMG51109]